MEKRLISSRTSEAELARQDLARARLSLRRALAPAVDDEIVKSLTYLAKTLGATVPEREGLAMYVSVLSQISGEALKHGFRTVLSTHRFPTLPLPAEILEAAGEKHRILVILATRVDAALARLN